MAQPTAIASNNTVKPITLTILPQPVTPLVLGPVPINVSGSTGRYSPPVNTTPIPNFNHVPTMPIVAPQQMSLEEKEQRRLAKQRERTNRYRDKTKPYIELANIPSEKDKIIALLKLCYPELSNVPELVIEQEVLLFIQTIRRNRY